MPFLIKAPGHPPYPFGGMEGQVTIGRSNENNYAIDDPSLSRRHCVLRHTKDQLFFEDLNSRNGSKVNGREVHSSLEIKNGDTLELGKINLTVEWQLSPEVPSNASQWFSLDEAREEFSTIGLRDSRFLSESLVLLQDISLDLLQDSPILHQIEKIIERLYVVYHPRRIVALSRLEDGTFAPLACTPNISEPIPVSTTAVHTICEEQQALLVKDCLRDVRVADAQSLSINQVSSFIAAPLVCEGRVEGILYAEATLGREPFGKRDLALLATVSQILATKIRTDRLLKERELMQGLAREMELATVIQQQLLPAVDPRFSPFEFYGRSIPSRKVGGDLFGYWQPTANRLYGAIADVSGKGVGPGLLMACLVAYMNGGTRANPTTSELAASLSRDLATHTTGSRFATAMLFSIEANQDWIEYTNAGHNPGLLVRATGTIERLESQGLPLALFPGTLPYGQGRIRMGKGDMLFLFTDGITEAADEQGDEYGLERLEQLVGEGRSRALPELVRTLDNAMGLFVNNAPFGDDRTLLIIRKTA